MNKHYVDNTNIYLSSDKVIEEGLKVTLIATLDINGASPYEDMGYLYLIMTNTCPTLCSN